MHISDADKSRTVFGLLLGRPYFRVIPKILGPRLISQRSPPYSYPCRFKIVLNLPHSVLSPVEHPRRKARVGLGQGKAFKHMLGCGGSAAGYHRYAHGISYSPGEGDVIAYVGPIPVHAGGKQLARTVLLHLAAPVDGIYSHGLSAAVYDQLKPGPAAVFHLVDVDAGDDLFIPTRIHSQGDPS